MHGCVWLGFPSGTNGQKGAAMLADRILEKLEGVRRTGRNAWVACCPAHKDQTPSLAIEDTGDRVLLFCHAGCDVHAVVAACGLDLSDLFERTGDSYEDKQRRPSFNARSVLAALLQDATHIYMVGADLTSGRALSDPDKAALLAAVGRIRYAAILAGAV